jgi:hypothetical protein
MSNLYRGPAIDASYQVSAWMPQAILVSDWLISKKIFSSETAWPNESKLGREHPPCLLTDQDEMSNLYRGPAIDASYQVSVHLAKRFQRRRFKKIGQSETRIVYGSHVC